MANSIQLAIRAKGLSPFIKRAGSIARRYGLTSQKMDQSLAQFCQVLDGYQCAATFPITASTLERHAAVIKKYLDRNLEFAVHGLRHVDYTAYEADALFDQVLRARKIFSKLGIAPSGYRSPYLAMPARLPELLSRAGFTYASNQPLWWDGLDGRAEQSAPSYGFEKAIAFYRPWQVSQRCSLPQIKDGLIEIPVSLPDDEILIERTLTGAADILGIWRSLFDESVRLGELFTLQLHPERISVCSGALSAVLAEARSKSPVVWIARLAEVAAWWKARAQTAVTVRRMGECQYHFVIKGPAGTSVYARSARVDCPSSPWVSPYARVEGTEFNLTAAANALIGISPAASPELIAFLREQGYILESSPERDQYHTYFDQTTFSYNGARQVIAQIEGSGAPLLKLGKWPHGAQSALSVTGDIDALTLSDYVLRLMNR